MNAVARSRPPRFLHSPFGISLTVFVVCQAVFLVIARFGAGDWMGADRGVEHKQTVFLLACVYGLVCVNTLMFLLDASRHLAGLQDLVGLDAGAQKIAARGYNRVISVLVLAIFISGGLAVLVVMTLVILPLQRIWMELLVVNEWASMILFGAFVYADSRCKRLCDSTMAACTTIDQASKTRLERLAKTVSLYSLAVDVPGLLGIVFIVASSYLLSSVVSEYYWHGYVAGAIGLHIAFSQTVLALLSAANE